MLLTIDENFSSDLSYLQMTTESVLTALGFMVMVPSNPDDQFFQVPEGFIQLIKMHNWDADSHYMLRTKLYLGVVRYLASQVQDKLPYAGAYVNVNDSIFIGNEQFKTEANTLIDFCFAEILEYITKMNEEKEQHIDALIEICMLSANLLVTTCQVSQKKISSFINKLFKMSDGFLENVEGGADSTKGKRFRMFINKTFDSFKRKKEASASEASMRASMASDASGM